MEEKCFKRFYERKEEQHLYSPLSTTCRSLSTYQMLNSECMILYFGLMAVINTFVHLFRTHCFFVHIAYCTHVVFIAKYCSVSEFIFGILFL